jgi:cystathionine beta-lyase
MIYTSRHIESQLVHAPGDNDPRYGDVVCPIHLTTTYEQEQFGKPLRYDYSRGGNPSRQVVEDQIAALEYPIAALSTKSQSAGRQVTSEGQPFCGGLAFATGMAAITAVLSLFEPGDEILVPSNLYGGTFRVLDRYFSRYGLSYRFLKIGNTKTVEQAFAQTPTPKAILFESPTNPLLEVANIAALAQLAKSAGALTIVDNTFMSPYLQRPLELGADIVIHSATKYLGGHSDVLAGLVATNNHELYRRLHFIQYSTGATLAAFDSYLLNRGIKTLALRMSRACDNATIIASYLQNDIEKNGRIAKVIYPGLPDHPGYGIQMQQAKSGGALIAFELADGLDAQAFAQKLKLVTVAESLGAVESLLCHPASMTHASIPADLRIKMGINDNLLRLSVGIEHVDDLLADIEQALAQ